MPTRTAEEWILYSALSSPVCIPEALSVYLQSHGANNNLLAQSWGESIILYLRAALAALIWSRFCARTALSGLRGRPTGPDRLSAPVIDNYIHYRSLPVIAGKFSNTIYHPDEFLRSQVTGQSTSGSASVFGFVTHGQSFRFRHPLNQS